jgi:hypothetical protein
MCQSSLAQEQQEARMANEREVGDEELMQRLRRQPAIRSRLVALLDVAEDSAGDLRLADDAEWRLTQEISAHGPGADAGVGAQADR